MRKSNSNSSDGGGKFVKTSVCLEEARVTAYVALPFFTLHLMLINSYIFSKVHEGLKFVASMGEMHEANMPSREGFQQGNEPHAEQMQQGMLQKQMTLACNRCSAEDRNHSTAQELVIIFFT
jgi:hypothetical protein